MSYLWMYRLPFDEDAASALQKYRDEILDKCPDWEDIRISDQPSLFSICPLDKGYLLAVFGTEFVTPELLQDENEGFAALCEGIQPGQGAMLTLYRDGKPDELCFLGYSVF